MANSIFYGEQLGGVTVNAVHGITQATFDSNGIAEVDPTDTNLVSAINKQGGTQVDVEGTEEAITPDVVQTATTLSAIVLRNDTGASVITIFDTDADGDVVYGPISIAANKERVIVFPSQLTVGGGVFVSEISGALNSTPGFVIP